MDLDELPSSTAYLAAHTDRAQAPGFMPRIRSVSAETLRQVVRLRRGGHSLRLSLSNEFGVSPLVIDGVTMRGERGAAVESRHRGRRRWIIPAGRTATSDPTHLPIGADEELTVDCFLAGPTEPDTFLPAAQRTCLVAPGDQRGVDRLADAEASTALAWITQVLVEGAGAAVVALGDSITRGDGTSIDRDRRYPDQLQRRIRTERPAVGAVLNAGISGNRLLRPGIGPAMVDRFDRDVLSVPGATDILLMGGLNDIALPVMLGGPRPSAGELLDGLFALADRAVRSGVTPMLATIPPMLGARSEAFRAPGNAEVWHAVNTGIRAQSGWAFLDAAVALGDPDDPSRLAPRLDSGDGIHPNDAGARALADAVDLSCLGR